MTVLLTGRSLAATLLLSAMPFAMASQTAFADNAPQDDPLNDEIIVTGSPFIRSIDEAITGVSVLTGDELADRLAGTIGETLKSEPGVSSTFFGAGASRPIIRGQGGDRVRVLTNGVGSIDASSASPDHAVAAEPAQAERIEVLRGASLLRYGSSGSGGIVNVIDGRIPDEVPEKLTGAVRIGASSVDQGREVAASIDQALGSNFVIHLDGTWREAGDYAFPGTAESARYMAAEEAEEHDDHDDDHDDDHHDDDHDDEHDHEDEEPVTGTLPNSYANSQSFTGGLSYVGDNGFFGVAVHRFESEYGIPGGHSHAHGEDEHDDDDDHDHDHEEGEEEENVFIGLEQTRVDVNGAVTMDGVFERLQFFGGYADYTHTEFEGPGEIGTVFANEGFEARLEAIQAKRGEWSAAYGVQLRSRDFSAIGAEAFVPPTKTRQLGIYTFHETEIGDVHLEGAVRYENTRQDNSLNNDRNTFNLFSASAGGDYHVSDSVRVGGTVFRTERAPTTEELYSDGPHLATDQFERGDPTLGKETATGIEAAFRHKEGGHFVTVNAFYTDYDNYIFELETGEEEDGLPVFAFTGQDTKFRGFEVQGGLDLGAFQGANLRVDGLAEYVRVTADGDNLPRIPPLSILTGIEAETDRIKLRAELDYAAKQSKVAAEELPTDDYGLVNLFATWKAPVGADNVRLKLSVLNLLDTEARQHTSFLKDQVPLPGRNIRFSIAAQF